MTNNEASRNFIWRVSGLILRALAHRNMSLDKIEKEMGWEKLRLEKFLINAIRYDDAGPEDFRLKDLALIMHHLDFEIDFSVVPNESEPTV